MDRARQHHVEQKKATNNREHTLPESIWMKLQNKKANLSRNGVVLTYGKCELGP
jgi:hypothetical protein